MASLNPGRQQRLLQRAAMRGARGRFGAGLRADRAPTLRVEGLESRVMLAAAPVITAPQIFGVRPGSPFLFDVTASGDRPMTFSAAGLPAGLTLNAQTGLITGSLTSYATYDLTVTATNPSGSDTQNFRIVVGDKIGLTPAMGWNSWTIFPTNLTQSIVQAQAAAMASSGLVNYGWSYINMDAGWEGGRTADGQPIRGNSNFPDMQGMADYIHSLNLKFGVYTVPQNVGYVGELAGSTGNNLWADAQQFATWGVDYLKYDGDPPSQNDTIQAYQAMRASGRDIIMSASTFSGLSPSAAAFYFKWNQSVRTGPDITDAFLNVLNDGIIYQQNWLDSIGPGHWGDSDNLQLGVVKDELGVHPTKLTPNQQQSQVSIWVMNASPLLLGNDLTQLDAATLKWLTNEEVLAIDQDPLGIPSRAVNGNTSVQMRPLADGSIAVELLNVSNTSNNITISFSDLGLTGPQIVRDVWQKQDVGTFNGAYTATIGADGTALLVLRAATAGAPQITGQPINQYVDVGSPATFTVSATGAGLMYQWTKNGTAIPGAFGATYTTPNTTAADDGAVYRCIVTNLVGKVMSYEADLAVRGTTQYLSDYRYYFGTTGYYSIQNDHSVTGGVISIGGVTYSKGIGTHSPSEIDFYLGGKGGTFNADVGIDSNQPGFAKFQVFVDGVKVYDSGVLTGGMAPVPVSVDIRGAQVLSLVVANGAANNDYAQADWANARITTSLVPLTLPTVTSFARTTAFNTVQPFAPGDFTAAFSDVTPGQSLQNLKITSVPAHGALKLSGTTVVAGQSLTLAQVSNLTYVPANGYSGPDSFGWNGSDQIGYALVAATVNITVQTPPPPTAVPLMPVASASASGQTSIVLTWTDLSVSPNVASSYLILRSTDGVHFSQAATASASTSSITLSGLAAGTTYFFEVAGVNVIGNSPVSAAASTVTVVPPVLPAAPSTNFDYSSGFAPGLPLTYNGNTFLNTNFISITNNQPSQRGSFFYNTPQSITSFTTQFDFQISGTWPLGDGFTFVIQNSGLNALGQGGGGLGYGASGAGGSGGINKSVAIKFDVFSNEGEGTNSTGLYLNGAAPTTGGVGLDGTGFNMRSYNLSRATISYNGTILTVTLKDLVTGATATQNYTVDIASIVGGTQAYVGFTGAAGSIYSYQSIMNWKYASSSAAATAPSVPAGLTALAVGNSAIVSWTAAASASNYTLKYATTAGGPYTTVSGIVGTAYTLPGLAAGATYYFVVSASNVNGTSVDSPQVSATLPPSVPTGLAAAPSSGQVTLNWTASAGAASYNVKYATVPGGPYTTISGVTGTSKTVTGLTNGVNYYFVISAVNAGGESANSAETSAKPVLPIPASPAGLNAVPGNGTVSLTWNATTFATSYTVKYGTTSGGPYTGTLVVSGTSANVTGLTAGATYYFVVSASNSSGEGANSSQVSGLLVPAVPGGLNAVGGNGQAALTWSPAVGAASYTVKYGTSNGGPYTNSVIVAGTGTTVTGLAPGGTYYFVVTATNATGESVNSPQAGTMIVPSAPAGLNVVAGSGLANLTWNAAAGAMVYTVKYGTTSGGPYAFSAQVSGTSATIGALTPGATYYFVVTASNAAGESGTSAQGSALLVPAAPTGVGVVAGNGQATVNWTGALGASSYIIKYGTTSGGPYTGTVAGITGTSAAVTGLTPGGTYYFVVVAANATGQSGNSTQAGATLVPPAPAGVNVAGGNGQATVTWSAALGATGYTVKYSTTGGGPYTSVAATGGSATITGLTAGSTYFFVVSASNAAGESANSAQSSTTLVPGVPVGLNATAGNAQAALSWNAVAGATGYTIKYGTTSGGPYAGTFAASGPGGTVTGLANGVTYYFVVTASNGGGESASSTQTSALPQVPAPGAPTGLNAVAGNGQVALTWNAVAGTSGYTVKYGTTAGGPYILTQAATGASATVSGLANGVTYYFVVTASNAGGESANSAQASAMPVLPAPGAPTGVSAAAGNGQAVVSWTAVGGATGYTVKYGTTPGGPYTVSVPAAGSSATVGGLTNGTTYYFVVTATSAGGESGNSAQASAVPLPPAPGAPSGLVVTAGNGQAALVWNSVAGAASYNVRYGTTSGGPYTTTVNVASPGATITGLSNGTTYYFVVSAVNLGGESGNSAQGSGLPVAPAPAAPAGLTLTPGNTQIGASWASVSGATSYNVKYGTTSGGPYTTINVVGTNATVTGLTNGTAYFVVVSAVGAGGESANSTQLSATPAGATATILDYSTGFAAAGPTLQINGHAQIVNGALLLTDNSSSRISSVFATTQQNVAAFSTQFDFQITGSWPLGDGFTFVIQRSGTGTMGQGGGGLGYQGIGNSIAIKFDFFDNAGEGTNSTGLSVNGAAPLTAGSVWLGNTAFDMRSYDLSRATMTYDGTTLSVTLKDLRTGTTATQNYTIDIPGVIGGNTAWVGFTAASGALMATQQIWNWTYSSTGSAPPPSAPGNITTSARDGQVGLTWGGVAGATSYNVKYGTTPGGPYTTTVNVTGTGATIRGLANGTPYYFVVTAVGASGESSASAQVSAVPQIAAPASPGGLAAVPGMGQMGVTWNAVAGAASYNLKYSATSGGPYTMVNVADTGTTVTGLANGTAYYFVVSAVNAGGESANSAQISGTTLTPPPVAPSGLNATPGNAQIRLTWTAVAGATSYNVKYSTTSGGPYTTVNVGGTSTTISGLANATTYYFVVSAINGGGEGSNSGQISAAPVLPPPATPTGFGATAGNHQVTLAWNAVVGATSYTVRYGTSNGGPYVTTISGLTGTGATIAGLSNGTIYYFVITASNSAGESAASTQVSAVPLLPLPVAPTGLNAAAANAQVSLSWNAVAGATSYNVKASTASGGPYTVLAANVTALSANITNLTNGTTYYFVVSANNASGEGANSTQVQAMPLGPIIPVPVRPSDLTATAGNASVTLNWSLISGATSYNIRYGTTAGGPYTTALTGITANSVTIPNLTNGTAYYFVATAVNSSGESANSTEVSAKPVLPGAPVTTIDLSNGFAGAGSTLAINGSAYIDGGQLKLTDGHNSQVSSVYARTQQNITNFSTQFDFQITGNWPLSEGFTFVIQRAGLSAIGQGGGGLGYGAMSTGPGITSSVAIKFDVYDNAGEGTNSTGLYVNGASPTSSGSVWLGNTGFDMRSYDFSRAAITYDGTTLRVTLTNLRTGATATQQYTVNIPALIGGNTAWIGFTGADGSIVSNQTILNWKYATI